MNWHRQASRCVFWMLLVAPSTYSAAHAQPRPDQQAWAVQTSGNRQGFFDYALGKVNPQQTDYGAQVATGRALIVAKTLDNLFFWSNVVAILLFTGVTTLYVSNLCSGNKRELIAASLITELWNGRLNDRAEIGRRTKQYNLLVEKHNAILEQSHNRSADNSPVESRAELQTQRKIERLIEGSHASATTANKASGITSTRKLGSVQDAITASDLQQQNFLLERRIEAMLNTEQNLKERLNQTAALLEKERQRNRALKGA